jgi:GntR family transcriptional regulator
MPPIDPTSGRPRFQQIAADLREQIFQRTLKRGDKLPSRTQLVAEYGCAEETVARALDVLKREGLVISQQGVGNFVRSAPLIHRDGSTRYLRDQRPPGTLSTQAEAAREGQVTDLHILSVERVRPPADVALKLDIDESNDVLVRRHLVYVDEVPVALIDSYYHLQLVAGTKLEKNVWIPGGVDHYMIETLGVQLRHFTEELRARNPTAAEVTMLHLRDDEPVIHLVRTKFDARDNPIQVSIQRLAGDKYVLRYDVPAS